MLKRLLKLILCLFYQEKYLNGSIFSLGYYGYKVALRSIWQKNILRLAKPQPWPTALTCNISESKNIIFDPNDISIFLTNGTYFQNFNAKIYIGSGTLIASNVGIITANHDLNDLNCHMDGDDVIIGKNCWIGMNSVILPGVKLCDKTIVAAGAVVTKSFPKGNIVIGGVPAIIIRHLD